MALKPIVGEIKAQPLNDNLSYLDQKAGSIAVHGNEYHTEPFETKADADAQKAEKVTDVGGVHGLEIKSGIWTPDLIGSITEGSNTYSVQKGNYYKIGRLVKATFLLTLSTKDVSMDGSLNISGLPYSLRDSNERNGVSFSYIHQVTLNTGYTTVIGNLSSNKILLYESGSGLGISSLTPSAISDVSAIWGSITYEANS